MNFARIKTIVRGNCGWSGEVDLTTARLEEIINYVYTRKIPSALNWKGFDNWFFCRTVAETWEYRYSDFSLDGAGTLSVGDRVKSIKNSTVMDDPDGNRYFMKFSTDFQDFNKKYLQPNPDSARPEIIYRFGDAIYPSPKPDGEYVIRLSGQLRPAELSDSGDEPTIKVSEAIIAGATAMIAEQDEEVDKAVLYWGIYEDRLKDEAFADISQNEGRIRPRW